MTRIGRNSPEVRRAEILLDEQMWLFGQDIRHENGNLLIRYGCRRQRDPANTTSAYIHEPDEKQQMTLWSFGLLFCDEDRGGMFLPRFSFTPRWMGRWRFAEWNGHLDSISRHRSTCDASVLNSLLRQAALWLAGYEDWVLSIAGIDYRRACVERWRKKRCIPVEAIAGAWRELAAHFDRISRIHGADLPPA